MTMRKFEELSSEELDRIESRIAAATAGPWLLYSVGRDSDADGNLIELGSCNEVGTFKSIELTGASAADEDFIANARQDLPRLLREVRWLRARLQSLDMTNEMSSDDLQSQRLKSVVETPAFPLSSM